MVKCYANLKHFKEPQQSIRISKKVNQKYQNHSPITTTSVFTVFIIDLLMPVELECFTSRNMRVFASSWSQCSIIDFSASRFETAS